MPTYPFSGPAYSDAISPGTDEFRYQTLLTGVVGSHAQGLANSDSDTDLLSIMAIRTEDLVKLRPPTEKQLTIVEKNPDHAMHEVGKFCRLAFKCNPSILELLWLRGYTRESALGIELLQYREDFLSAKPVKDAYLGYARSQIERIRRNGGFQQTAARVAKYGRHLARLITQGVRLHTTGHVQVMVTDAEEIRQFGNLMSVDIPEGLRQAEMLMQIAEETMRNESVLPDKPRYDRIEEWLQRVRRVNYSSSLDLQFDCGCSDADDDDDDYERHAPAKLPREVQDIKDWWLGR